MVQKHKMHHIGTESNTNWYGRQISSNPIIHCGWIDTVSNREKKYREKEGQMEIKNKRMTFHPVHVHCEDGNGDLPTVLKPVPNFECVGNNHKVCLWLRHLELFCQPAGRWQEADPTMPPSHWLTTSMLECFRVSGANPSTLKWQFISCLVSVVCSLSGSLSL